MNVVWEVCFIGEDLGELVGFLLLRCLVLDVLCLMFVVLSCKRGGCIFVFLFGEFFGGNVGGRLSMFLGFVVIWCLLDFVFVFVLFLILWGMLIWCEGDVGVGMFDGWDGSLSFVFEDLLLWMGWMEGGGFVCVLLLKECWG